MGRKSEEVAERLNGDDGAGDVPSFVPFVNIWKSVSSSRKDENRLRIQGLQVASDKNVSSSTEEVKKYYAI